MKTPALEDLVSALRKNRDQQPSSIAERRSLNEIHAEKVPIPDRLLVNEVRVGGVPADELSFADHDGNGALLYLHGGAYAIGSPSTHRALAARLGRAAGLNALVPDYRLAPENPFPAAVEDALASYRWLIESGTSPERIVIAGDSAGGGLAMATLLSIRDHGNPLPVAAAILSPWTDLAMTGESLKSREQDDPMLRRKGLAEQAEMYLDGHDPMDPLASPIYADFTGLPPLIIHVGSAEILFDDSVRLAERAKAAGVEVSFHVYEDMMHVWHYFAGLLPEGESAIEEIGQFMWAKLNHG
jgi:acetyl esterase/lipase